MRIESLYWDDDSIESISRNGINPADIEEVCFGEHISIRGQARRHVVYGKTKGGTMIMFVLERLYAQNFKPVTVRIMTDKEKQYYLKKLGE